MKKITLFCMLCIFCVCNMTIANAKEKISGNEFNPAISVILDGRYTDIDDTLLNLPGFQLGGEAGLPENGFSTGHNELVISANIDDKFYGQIDTAIIYENNQTIVEIEEVYIKTLGLGGGLTFKAGQFFSSIGRLNSMHDHTHDFTDRPLVYDAIFGGHLVDTGVHVNWLAPTDFYLNIGAELVTGSTFPGGTNNGNDDGLSVFAKTGGDIGKGGSWQLGIDYYQTKFDTRTAGGHSHGGGGTVINELLGGKVDTQGVNFVYKWAPQRNSINRNFKIQAEYFLRNETGTSQFIEAADASATASYKGKQYGFYVQTIYQFVRFWRIGARFDYIKADNLISNYSTPNDFPLDEFLAESGLGTNANNDNPTRLSFMIDYSPSEFSRIRLQYNNLDNGIKKNGAVMLQYLMSLGAHGAHTF